MDTYEWDTSQVKDKGHMLLLILQVLLVKIILNIKKVKI